MLDVKTIGLVLAAQMSLMTLVWGIAASVWRDMPGLKAVTVGYGVMALGIAVIVFNLEVAPPIRFPLGFFIIRIGTLVVASGVIAFFGQPPRFALMACLAAGLVALGVLADNDYALLQPVVLMTSSAIVAIAALLMIHAIARDRSTPVLLKRLSIGTILLHFVFSFAFGLTIAQFGSVAVARNLFGWFLIENALYLLSTFCLFLLVLGARLTADLTARNAALRHEVGERQRLAGRLSASLGMERLLREDQRQLMRLVSHEFRNPLAIIDRSAEMIGLTTPPTGAAADRLAAIRQAVGRMVALMDRFLRPEPDETEFGGRQILPLSTLLRDVVSALPADQATRLDLDLPVPDPDLDADRTILATAIGNLVENAFKYAPEDSRVELVAAATATDVTLEIRDRGLGIPPEDLAVIGRRYVRGSNVGDISGTGLGLYSARRLLDEHHATLDLARRAGGGTVATVRLPRAARPEARSHAA